MGNDFLNVLDKEKDVKCLLLLEPVSRGGQLCLPSGD